MKDFCNYCTEDSDGDVVMNGAFYITESVRVGKHFINTGHCKQREIYFCPWCGRRLESGYEA